MKYSIKKGLLKALLSVVSVGAAVIAFAGFSDIVIWDLLETHLKPILGSLSIGAVLVMAINWIKVKLL